MGTLTPKSDEHLAREAAQGALSAFETLVHRHQDRIYGFINRMVRDPEKARDLTQEVFFKAWKGLSGFREQSRFATWIYRIAHNVVTSAGRYEAARPKIRASLDGGSEDERCWGPEPASPGDQPDESALRSERRRLVLEGVGRLTPDQREMIVLRDMEDRSYEEIAEILDIPVGTVRSRLHRARSELKQRLKHHFES